MGAFPQPFLGTWPTLQIAIPDPLRSVAAAQPDTEHRQAGVQERRIGALCT